MNWAVLLAAVGFTTVLTQSVITRRIRALWPALLECPMCSGVWVGAIVGLVETWAKFPDGDATPLWYLHGALVGAFATSAASYALYRWLDYHDTIGFATKVALEQQREELLAKQAAEAEQPEPQATPRKPCGCKQAQSATELPADASSAQ